MLGTLQIRVHKREELQKLKLTKGWHYANRHELALLISQH